MMKKRGFSLIEIVIAIGLLTIVMSAMLSIFSQGQRYLRKNRVGTIAGFLIQEKLEELSTPDPSLFSDPNSFNEVRADVPGFTDFEREVAVSSPYLGDSGLAFLRVTVWWQGETGEQTRTVETVKADY
ncbi:MAG: type II secretion system protein [Candidatus Omnitrophica bacterium]|jgi:prepilin-type N-terminal cleavage/methylation domain-containing protein|nr:type II secretion system protein [Candidatus Omnitrophota bacterium]MDD5655202.1 type II secretion system protein [Candidatus Omnitrophota bacterium]